MNKHIVVVGKEDTKEEYNNFDKLNFLSVYDVKDKSKKRLVYAKLNYEGNRLLVETDYLNLIEVDLSKNYFIDEQQPLFFFISYNKFYLSSN